MSGGKKVEIPAEIVLPGDEEEEDYYTTG